MRRRTLLCVLGSGVAGIAGCSGSPSSEPAATSTAQSPGAAAGPANTAEPTTGGESGAQEPEPSPETPTAGGLRLLSIEPPEPVQIGEEVDYRFTVENPGEEPSTIEPTVSSRSGGSGWSIHERWDPVELPPGGRHTFGSSPFTSEYLSTVELRIDGFGPTFSAEFTERRLPFSEEFRDPLDREVSIEDLSVHSVYEYESGGYRRVVELGGSSQFVFVTVDVVNRTDESVEAPERVAFSLLADGQSYHPIRMPGGGDYEPEEIPWGARTGGRVAYKTPAGLSRGDFRVAWYDSFEGDDVGVIWTPD